MPRPPLLLHRAGRGRTEHGRPTASWGQGAPGPAMGGLPFVLPLQFARAAVKFQSAPKAAVGGEERKKNIDKPLL